MRCDVAASSGLPICASLSSVAFLEGMHCLLGLSTHAQSAHSFQSSAIDAVGLTRWKCRNAMERQETQRLGNKPPHNDSDTRKRCSTAAVGIDKEVGVGQGRINKRQPYRTGTSTGRKKKANGGQQVRLSNGESSVASSLKLGGQGLEVLRGVFRKSTKQALWD